MELTERTSYCLVAYFNQNHLSIVFAPAVTDCSEIYRLGFRLPGIYRIDPSGARKLENSVETFCQGGWTILLRRGLGFDVRTHLLAELWNPIWRLMLGS